MAAARNSLAWARTGWRPSAALLLFGLFPGALAAQGMEGRTVLFHTETWDDQAHPDLVGSDYVGRVGKGPEFGMVAEGNDFLQVVPVVIDVSETRIDFAYPGQPPGQFHVAAFNGYVLTFPAECTVITGARIDPAATTLAIDDSALILTPQSLMLNVQGQEYDADTRIGVLIEVGDCPMS